MGCISRENLRQYSVQKIEQQIPYHAEIVQYISKEQQEKTDNIQRMIDEVVEYCKNKEVFISNNPVQQEAKDINKVKEF